MKRICQSSRFAGAVLLSCVAVNDASLAQTYNCEWDGTLGQPGMTGRYQGVVIDLHAVGSFNGASALFALGFLHDDTGVSSNLAYLSGGSWTHAVDYHDSIKAVTSFDDGSGAAIYIGGWIYSVEGEPFTSLARWDGTTWSVPGDGVNGVVDSLNAFDLGDGEALYVGGNFSLAGGTPANRIARWDGTSWSALAGGLNADVHDACVFNDGRSHAIYFAGSFTEVDGLPADGLAAWDGSSWTVIMTEATGGFVAALTSFDDGSSSALYVGGSFTSMGGLDTTFIACWDGSTWNEVGESVNGPVWDLHVAEIGGEPMLIAGGAFTMAGDIEVSGMAAWNGEQWIALGDGMNGPVFALETFNVDSSGKSELVAGGGFTVADGQPADLLAHFAGASWSAFPADFEPDYDFGFVNALVEFDDGSATALYACGEFLSADGNLDRGIARWTGSEWQSLQNGLAGWGLSMIPFDDGTGHALYVGGTFTMAGAANVSNIARWNGEGWSDVGGGVGGTWCSPMFTRIDDMAVYEDGSGPALYVAGHFKTLGTGGAALNIAKWDGESWSAVGGGLQSTCSGWTVVEDLAVFDDGTGAKLYAGGRFYSAGGENNPRLAAWDGTAWSGVSPQIAGNVFALEVFDDGGGPALYLGGSFNDIGDLEVNSIARWDGTSFSTVGGGVDGYVTSLQSSKSQDGTDQALLVGGLFSSAGNVTASSLARWDGESWSAMGTGFTDGTFTPWIFDLIERDTPAGRRLVVAGDFDSASGVAARDIVEVTCQLAADIDANGVVNAADLTQLMAQWGECPAKGPCVADIAPPGGGDGTVGPADLAELLANWG